MAKVKQTFDDSRLEDVEGTLQKELEKVRDRIKPGAKIAIAVGSRGIDALPEMTRGTVQFLKDLGAEPFIVPSMGSHGGATGPGQTEENRHICVRDESIVDDIISSL